MVLVFWFVRFCGFCIENSLIKSFENSLNEPGESSSQLEAGKHHKLFDRNNSSYESVSQKVTSNMN